MGATAPREVVGDKRARILEAAREICERDGVEAARMEDVAARAGVSKGTLYRYFRSKEDLLLATVLASYEDGLREIDAGIAPGAGPAGRLEAYLQGLTQLLAALAPGMSLHFQAWGVAARQPALRDRLYAFLRGFHRERGVWLAAAIRDGQRAGSFRPDADPEAFAQAIDALLSGFLYRATFDPSAAHPGALRACFDAVVRQSLEGSFPARPSREAPDV